MINSIILALRRFMASIKVNGESFQIQSGGRNNIQIRNNRVWVDGKDVTGKDIGSACKIEWEGPLASLIVEGDVACGDVQGDVDAGGSVQCKDVGGFVDAGGSINCGNVKGNVDAGGSIICGNVGGEIDAGGSVSCTR